MKFIFPIIFATSLFVACTSDDCNTVNAVIQEPLDPEVAEQPGNSEVLEENIPPQVNLDDAVILNPILVPNDTASTIVIEQTPVKDFGVDSANVFSEGLILNEVDPVNAYLKDHDDEDPPWVELYNPTPHYISLNSYYLTKNKEKMAKWTFGNKLLKLNSYMIVFLSDKDINGSSVYVDNAKRAYHTNFKIKNEGGSLYLTNGTNVIDSVNFPVVPLNATWSRKNGGWGFSYATPLKQNGTIYKEKAEERILSSSGFFTSSFKVQFENVQNSKIYCTLDGTTPTEKSVEYSHWKDNCAPLHKYRARCNECRSCR